MFDIPSIKIGKIFGIPFEVNLSWIVIFVLVSISFASTYASGATGAPSWLFGVIGVATAILFFGSILAHEVSHALVTKLEGGSVDKITLFIFGGVAQIHEEPKSPGREFVMAAAGPGMSLFIAAACYLGATFVGASGPWWVAQPLLNLAQMNAFIGIFNLLPGFPLDGGRLLRSVLWAVTRDAARATRWAARSGQVIGWGLVVLGVVMTLYMGDTSGIWLGLVGYFIAWLAGASLRQAEVQERLAGLTVERVMTVHPEFVDGAISLSELVDGHMLGRQHSRYPVIFDGAIIGVVSLDGVKSVPREQWPAVRVVDVTDRDLAVLSVDAATPVLSLLPRLAADRTGALLAVRDGHLVGIVTRADIIDVLNRQAVAP